MTQPYLMGMAEVIKPAQLFGKDPAKLSHMMAAMSPLVFPLHLLHTRETFNICTIWEFWIDGKFLMNHLCLLPGQF